MCKTEYATVGYMAKRIQMRKQRFMAIQKIQQEKKLQVESEQSQQSMGGMSQAGSEHGHSHGGHGHSHSHQHGPKQMVSGRGPGGYSNIQQNVGSRGCSIVGPLFQEVRFKVHDPKAHSKGGTLENTINGGRNRSGADSGPDEESGAEIRPQPPSHLLHPGKVSTKYLNSFSSFSSPPPFEFEINNLPIDIGACDDIPEIDMFFGSCVSPFINQLEII